MKNLLKLYRWLFRHWGYLIGGLIFMFSFALFSGASLTMVVPLFDYVFAPRTSAALYDSFPEFTAALGDAVRKATGEQFSVTLLTDENFRNQAIEAIKSVMAQTDPWLLLMVICVTFLIIVFLKNLFFFLNKYMFANLRGKTIVEIRNEMFRTYLQQSLKFFQLNKPGDSIVRMVNDVNIVSDMFIDQMFNLLRDFILLLVYAGIAISLNAKFFFMSLIVLPIFSAIMAWLGNKIKKYAKRIQQKFSDMFSNIEEVLNSMKIVKAFAREDFELERFKKINWKYFKFWRKSVVYASLNTPLGELHGTLTAILVILIGGRMVLDPNSGFTSGQFLMFLFAIFSMLHPMKTLTKAYADIRRAQVSLDRIFYILNREPEIVNDANPIRKSTFEKDIVLKNVNFSYKQDGETLKNINLTIQKGEKVAFVGSSGAGKTTLVNLLPRLYDVSEGEILIDGINIKKIDLKDLRKLFGTVTQDSILFTDTIANNIRYGATNGVDEKAIREAARIAYADEFIEKLPHKYDEMLSQKGSNLSGGQRQRLCIARAIVNDPPILIFDEATSALDSEAEKKVQQAIERATKNRTVLIIAHRLSTALTADRIVVMDQGKILDIGTHEELLKRCERYQTLYRLQFTGNHEVSG